MSKILKIESDVSILSTNSIKRVDIDGKDISELIFENLPKDIKIYENYPVEIRIYIETLNDGIRITTKGYEEDGSDNVEESEVL